MSKNYETKSPETPWQRDVLSYPLFEGEFGSPDDVVFKDRLVRCRANHQCSHCGGWALAGQTARRHVAKYDGCIRTYYFCLCCCDAMAKAFTDDGDAICSRFDLHSKE